MTRICYILLCVLIHVGSIAQNKGGAIGSWKGHYDTHSVKTVIKGDEIYVSTSFQIIKVNERTGASEWIDKTTGLHDIDIEHIAWDPLQSQLVITYANSNIDILKGDQIYNINAIQLTNIYADHKINSIAIKDQWGFVATNFGIVVLDLVKHEIKDTWFPNQSQQPVITYDIAATSDSLFATTENGIWSCPLKNNWIVATQWAKRTNLDNKNLKRIIQKNNAIYAYNASEIYKLPSETYVYKTVNSNILNIDTTLNDLLLCLQYPNNKGALVQFNKNYTTTVLLDSNVLAAPVQSLVNNNNFWIADSTNGLLLKSTTPQWINLGGPKATINGLLSINENNLVATLFTNPGFATLNENGWNTISQIGNTKLPYFYGTSISKLDNSYWFSGNNGIYHLNSNNTQLEYIIPNTLNGYYKQITIDQKNALWATQDQVGLVRQINNNWSSIALPGNFINKGLDKFIVNNQQQAWIIAPNKQGIYVYQSKDNFTTEKWKQLTTQASNGNLPSTNVTSIASDKLGNIWVGTDNGIGIFNCGDLATDPCNAYIPIVKNNGFNGYLFQKETVNCISIDGANRKWIGTNNGAWLLSEDGLEIIEHFTKNNSPLPSDAVLQIVISPNKGEVFFSTTKQMVSYIGTATQGAQKQNTIQIFPNPIPPSYTGLIAFRGLVENAIVKITDLTGRLLYQTTALGGQAIWNARTYEGKKVATGIYLVLVRDLDGNEKGVGKIVIADGY
jgi:ligand-binding sensor domain-containing protein